MGMWMAAWAGREHADESGTHVCTNTHTHITLWNTQWFCNTHQTPPTCLLSVYVGSHQSWQTADIQTRWMFRAVVPEQSVQLSKPPTRLLKPIPFTHWTMQHIAPDCLAMPTHACPHINGHTALLTYHTHLHHTHTHTHTYTQTHACARTHTHTMHVPVYT